MNDYSLILSYLLHYRFMTPYSLPYCIEWQARVGKDEELHMSTYSTSCFNFSLFYVPPFVPCGARSQLVAPHSNCPCTATAILALPLILCVRRHGRAAVASLPRDSRSGMEMGQSPEMKVLMHNLYPYGQGDGQVTVSRWVLVRACRLARAL